MLYFIESMLVAADLYKTGFYDVDLEVTLLVTIIPEIKIIVWAVMLYSEIYMYAHENSGNGRLVRLEGD